MNIRKYKTNPEILLEKASVILSKDSSARFCLRVCAVVMAINGMKAKSIGKVFNKTTGTISSWVKTADELGFEALADEARSGRPHKLSSEQREHITVALHSEPSEYGYNIWDGPSLSDYIKKTFGVDLSVRQCQRIFHENNLSLIRPQPFPSKGEENTEQRNVFKNDINQINENPNLVLVYQDEVHFQIQTTIASKWCPKGSAPRVKSYPGHEKVSYCGFVIPSTGELYVTKPDKFNFLTTITSIRAFLKAHPLPDGQKYAMVMDNAPWHKKAKRLIMTLEELSDISNKVVFIPMPPYSPDLNPIEQVWRITRREYTHNRFFPTLSTLEKTVDDAFTIWAVPNTKLKTLCSFKYD